MDGVKKYCEEDGNNKASVEVHRPESSKAIYADVPSNLKVSRISYHADPNDKWIVSHVRALDSCDVLIALAGGKNTNIIGNLAAEKEIPVLTVGNFGGSAADLYEKLKYIYKNKYDISQGLQYLTNKWEDWFADEIIGLAEALTRTKVKLQPHSYFISYSWDDCAFADHIEVLLRRNNRVVFRDESNIESGKRISSAVSVLIDNSDTLIAIWSKNYSRSQWCMDELEFARKKQVQSQKQKLRRIALIAMDEQQPPIHFTDPLYIIGKDRPLRELGIKKLLEEEKV